MIKLLFSNQNVYNFQRNINAKAAQIKPIAREPFQTQNRNTIEAKHNNYSNIMMNEIQSENIGMRKYSTIRLKKTTMNAIENQLVELLSGTSREIYAIKEPLYSTQFK